MPYYLKIDIEGADHLVLEVLKASGERPPYLSMESEKVSFARLEAELQALQALGYRKFAAVQQEGIGKSFVRVTSRSGESLRFAFEDGASGVFGEDLRGWMDPADCLRRYKAIFRLYRWFGDRPLIGKIPGGRRIASLLRRRILRRPLPGWYDTHAALE